MNTENTEEIRPKHKYGPLQTYIAGAVASITLFIITVLLLGSGILPLILGLIMAVGGFMAGLQTIEVVHVAVLTVFERRTSLILSEGVVWTVPWFTGLIPISMKEKSIMIGDDNRLEILCVNTLTPIFESTDEKVEAKFVAVEPNHPDHKRAVKLKIKILVRYRIVSPAKFLTIKDEATLEKNIVEFSKDALREFAGHTDFMVMITQKDEVSSYVEKEFMRKVRPIAATWGVEIIDFALANAVPANAEMVASLEKQAREASEASGEELELKKFGERVKKLAKELDIDHKTAAEMALAQMDKAQYYAGIGGDNEKKNVSVLVNTAR